MRYFYKNSLGKNIGEFFEDKKERFVNFVTFSKKGNFLRVNGEFFMSKIERYLETRLWNCKKQNPGAKLPNTNQLLGELKSYYFVPVGNPKIAAKFRQKIIAARKKVSRKYKSTQKKIDIWSEAYQLPVPLMTQWILIDEFITNKAAASSVAKIIKDWQQFTAEQERRNSG